jgi:hypothetical protein
MELADMRPVRLGHDHAHEVVRLRVERRDAHGVARVRFRFAERAAAEERERERLGRGHVVGVEPHDALEQRLAGRRLALARANFLQEGERAEMQRRALEELKEKPSGFGRVACGPRRAGPLDLFRTRRWRPGRRPVEGAATLSPEPTAAGAIRSRAFLCFQTHFCGRRLGEVPH